MAYSLVDGSFEMDATGIVEPVSLWVEKDGLRVRSDEQAVNDAGVPLWNIGVSWLAEEWGRQVEKSAVVTVPSAEVPVVKRHRPIKFRGLTVTPQARLVNGRAILVERFAGSAFAQQGGNGNG